MNVPHCGFCGKYLAHIHSEEDVEEDFGSAGTVVDIGICTGCDTRWVLNVIYGPESNDTINS